MSCGGTQNFPFWDTRVDLGRLPGGSSYSSVNTKCVCAGLGERVFQSGDRALQRPGGEGDPGSCQQRWELGMAGGQSPLGNGPIRARRLRNTSEEQVEMWTE